MVEDYEAAQLQALRTGLLVSGIVALAALMFTRELPNRRPEPRRAPRDDGAETSPDDQPEPGIEAAPEAEIGEKTRGAPPTVI